MPDSPPSMLLWNRCSCYFRKLYEEDEANQPTKPGRGQKGRDRTGPAPRHAHSEEATEALLQWRRAVTMATSASQMAVSVNELDRCLAWERSATKVVRALG